MINLKEMEIPGRLSDIGKMDIYLIDQLQKDRVRPEMKILDAGFGRGRNLEYFVKNDFEIYGIDHNPAYLPQIREKISRWNAGYPAERMITGKLDAMPYPDKTFDFVFSIAVLHFAESHQHFTAMLDELFRILKPGGHLIFRMTSWHTFTLSEKTETGLVEIADGRRYMLNIHTLKQYMLDKGLIFSDPVKTTNVEGLRTMTTVVIKK